MSNLVKDAWPGNANAPSGAEQGFNWPMLIVLTVFVSLVFHNPAGHDTFWHIATGQWILTHKQVPVQDVFSHTMYGHPWIAHEWLSEVILAFVYDIGGWAGLTILVALVYSLTLALIMNYLLKYMEPLRALELLVLTFALTAIRIIARPHLLAMPVMVLWVLKLTQANDNNENPSLWLPPLMCVWANLHGGFTLGIALAVVFAAEAVFNAKDRSERMATALKWGIFVALSVGFAALTPNGIEGLLFTLHVFNMPYVLSHIDEWLSPDFHKVQALEIFLLLLIVIALIRGLKLPPFRVLLLAGFVHLALKHVRYSGLLGLLVPVILAKPLAEQLRDRGSDATGDSRLDRMFRRLNRKATPGALVVTVAGMVVGALAAIGIKDFDPGEEYTLKKAISAVQSKGVSGPVLNTYRFGGTLILSGIAPFVDGRADMYGDEFIEQYVDAVNLVDSSALPAVLNEYGIAWTVLSPGTPAVALLDQYPQWERIYDDEYSIVHALRNDSVRRSTGDLVAPR
jgi:hypothetical protein